jgi:hypothetical protein
MNIKDPENKNSFGYIVADMRFIPETEYNKLLNENIQLKKDLISLYENERLLKETIKLNEITIEELRKENEMLRNDITILKNKIKEQD